MADGPHYRVPDWWPLWAILFVFAYLGIGWLFNEDARRWFGDPPDDDRVDVDPEETKRNPNLRL